MTVTACELLEAIIDDCPIIPSVNDLEELSRLGYLVETGGRFAVTSDGLIECRFTAALIDGA